MGLILSVKPSVVSVTGIFAPDWSRILTLTIGESDTRPGIRAGLNYIANTA